MKGGWFSITLYFRKFVKAAVSIELPFWLPNLGLDGDLSELDMNRKRLADKRTKLDRQYHSVGFQYWYLFVLSYCTCANLFNSELLAIAIFSSSE